MPDYSKDLQFAKNLAKKAGLIMFDHFKVGVERQNKDNDTPVTIADTKINQMVIDEVKKDYPNYSVVGEEDSYTEEGSEFAWVCDPIDGTIPYMFGTPTCMFSLALVKNGRPVVAVLYDPFQDRMYEAYDKSKTLLNGEVVSVNNETFGPTQFMAMPMWKSPIVNNVGVISDLLDKEVTMLCLLSITYECTAVINGQSLGSVFPAKSPWDIAAIKLIIENAGGKVTDIDGNEQRYDTEINGALISNGRIHNDLVEIIKNNKL